MADEKSPEQLQQEMFDQSNQVPQPPPEPDPTPPPAPQEPPAEPPPQVAEPAEVPIPSWRLREEAEARRLAEDRARTLESRLNEINTHLQQQQKQPDFFEDPNKATTELLVKLISPYVQETRQQAMYNSELIAKAVHGADKVAEAEEAFLKARSDQTLDPMDYERVVQSPNRYDAVVQWQKRQTVLSSVGDDPNAWFEKQLEAKMADPTFQAKVLEKARSSAATRPSETRLPPSLSKSTAAAAIRSEPTGDMSDISLFRHAMDTKRPQ